MSAPRLSLTAKRYVARLSLLDPHELYHKGFRLILLDRDNTCVARGQENPPSDVVKWCASARDAGLTLCLISNNWHTSIVDTTAQMLGCESISFALKPAPGALRHAMRRYGMLSAQTLLVGDQIFTDVLAANLAGIASVLVRPLVHRDLWYTLIFRIFERAMLHNKTFEGEDPHRADRIL